MATIAVALVIPTTCTVIRRPADGSSAAGATIATAAPASYCGSATGIIVITSTTIAAVTPLVTMAETEATDAFATISPADRCARFFFIRPTARWERQARNRSRIAEFNCLS
jgi:hypothetical protein